MTSKQMQYGLRLTDNSKTGPAFSLPRSSTCLHKTRICAKVCYGNGIRYQSHGQKAKREQNWRTVQLLLQHGGPQLLAENLILLIDQARPADWLTAQVTGTPGVPWSLRLQDVGDFMNLPYIQAWQIAVKNRPQCSFWFYTRSFVDEKLFAAMSELAALPNCQAWLSVDQDNYEAGILAYCQRADVWKVALLQEREEVMPPDLIPALTAIMPAGKLVSFPQHRGGHHVPEIKATNLTVCPQVLGTYPLETDKSKARPCQTCAFCLPQLLTD
jgi:hypothetical protein